MVDVVLLTVKSQEEEQPGSGENGLILSMSLSSLVSK